MIFCIIGMLVISTNLCFAGGDLIVDGKVGIGTTIPNAKLDVISSSISSDTQIGEFAAPGSTAGVGYVTFGSGYVGWDYTYGGLAINAQTAGGSIGGIFVKRIDSGHSNIGIGTMNPGYKLDVSGDIRASGSIRGNLTGNVTGNVTGSSGSCTGNAVTATTANYANSAGLALDAVGTGTALYMAESGMRVIRGAVTGAGVAWYGASFASGRNNLGDYSISYFPAFSSVPTVAVTCMGNAFAYIQAQSNAGVNIHVVVLGGYPVDAAFEFIAIGPK